MKPGLFCLLLFTALFAVDTKAQNFPRTLHDPGIYTTLEWVPGEGVSLIPQIWINAHNWYLEARYNYEDVKTLSLYFGRSFYLGNEDEWELTPMAGVVTGEMSGISPALNLSVDWSQFSSSSQLQYTIDLRDNASSFFYSWTSFSFSITENLGAGGGLVIYSPNQGDFSIINGPMYSYTRENVTLELYAYNFWDEQRLWALAIEWLW